MTSQLVIIRVILGILAIAFAYNLGRNVVLVSQGAKLSTAMSWAFRTFAALAGVLWMSWRDRISILVIVLSVLSAAAGYYMASRPTPQPEDLTRKIFPES